MPSRRELSRGCPTCTSAEFPIRNYRKMRVKFTVDRRERIVSRQSQSSNRTLCIIIDLPRKIHSASYIAKAWTCSIHVWTKVQKPTPLGRRWDGPYKILERLGDTSLKIQVGEFASGQPRSEIRHWRSCQPADFEPEETAERPKLGRPKKNDET